MIFMVDGAKAVNSCVFEALIMRAAPLPVKKQTLVIRSPMPVNMVVPPERTTLAYKSLRISTSHFMMHWKVVSWIPEASFPMKLGWNST